MSAKWRALQHRHRYTYSSVVFPKPYIETLDLLTASSSLSSPKFLAELTTLASLSTTYAQVSAAKSLASAFSDLLASSSDATASEAAVRLYLEILFLENSLPLHRTLISPLARHRSARSLIGGCLASLCVEYGTRRRFAASRAVLSFMGFPKLGFLMEALEDCAVPTALDVSTGLTAVVSDVKSGSRPSPAVMEHCQEALSCLYYVLQKFPQKFLASDGRTVFDAAVMVILSVLRSSAFTRDCLVAAGVSFCAALQVCMNSNELPFFIAERVFGVSSFDESKHIQIEEHLHFEVEGFSVLSRICLLRGLLTAIPRPMLNARLNCSWTVLCNGVLPELCSYCENPVDSHFNFHALTVMQICLQQIKTSVSECVVSVSVEFDPFPEDMVCRLLRIVWNNLEDPLNQTVKQVHLVFDLLLDIHSSFLRISPGGGERMKLFLLGIAVDLLKLGPRCKGRYVPLASLARRLSSKTILELNPNLLSETVYAYIEDDVCCAVTSFLKCFLECLRDECWSSDGIEGGYVAFRGLCLPPILEGLVSGIPKLRTNLNTYALHAVLDVDVDAIFAMLDFISIGPMSGGGGQTELTDEQRVAALVSLLKVSRALALIEGDIDWCTGDDKSFASLCMKGIDVKIPVVWLRMALTHVEDSLRIDAAESLFLNPKTASLPSSLELILVREAVPLNMRCCSTAFQMKWNSLFRKFFSRVRTTLERQNKLGCWRPIAHCKNNVDNLVSDVRDRADDLFQFMKWLSSFLLYSCYPSAPYERKIMAMELIRTMIDVWPTVVIPSSGDNDELITPYSEWFTSPESTLLLVGSIVDSWDRLRESSFRILMCFPTPLPGISDEVEVKILIVWAKKLVCSPRVRESDAGALTLRLVFKKYVLELGWMVGASAEVICSKPQLDCMMNGASETDKSRTPLVEYIFSLVEWLRLVVEQGEKDLLEACKNSFVHGVLLSLRYTFEELDWNSEVVSSSISGIRCALQELLGLVMRISSLALWVVSADAWYLPNDMDDDNIDDLLLSDVQIEMDVSESSSGFTDKSWELMDSVRPTEQVVMVGCWLAMKEVSLLLGTIIRKIPLPSCTSSNSSDLSDVAVENVELPSLKEFDMVLDFKQLKNIGNHFLQVLLKMKHNGAIDKTRAGFTALCNRLLCSNDSRLCKLTESWMELLMEKMVSQSQTVDDLLRRSAGIPAAFIALFLAEPEGMPKKLLPQALRWLIDVATMSLPHVSKVKNQNGEVTRTTKNQISEKSPSNGRASKSRDEGVIPTVHAFNVLRVAFNDTNLATDTSGFSAEALIISIRSFASPYWEVRNSACLAYTALVRRMIGFLNVHKRESARRALTGLEFFYRYPSLHSFLLSELKIATDSLENGCTKSSEFNIVKAIHPSLCPILILLSRLKPSQVSIATNDVLDPLLFMPFTRRCATQNNLRVRVLASRALTGLVSNEKLQAVMRCIAEGLPQGENQAPIPNGICLNSHSPSSMVNGTNIEKSHHVSFNSIHGILLQLSALLDTNCRSLIDVSRKDQILEDLIKILVKCSWIGSIKSCPCPTLNSSYLQVLNHMMDIARTCGVSKHFTHVRSFLMELSLECLDAEVSRRPSLYDPTKAELRRQAAFSYFGCVFDGSAEATDDGLEICKLLPPNSSNIGEDESLIIGLHEKLLVCISDDMHEVRLATLKCLFRLLKFMKCSGHRSPTSESTYNFYMWAKSNLQPTLMERLYVENNPKCIYYILRNIFLWNVLQLQKCSGLQNKEIISFMGVDRAFVFQFWDRLVSLNKCVPRAKTRESLLCCMGICVRHLAILFRNSASSDDSQIDGECTISSRGTDQSAILTIYECINFFINLVKQHSASSEPVNMRRAAAESLIASGLLEEALWVGPIISEDQNSFGEELISDSMEQITDELEPAKAINFYAQRILDLWVICIRLLEDEDIQLRQNLSKSVLRCIDSKGSTKSNLTESAPAQVEKVIVSSFEFLSSVFGHWTLYIDYLLRWVLDMGHYIRAQGDLVRRVFDKEIDNHHEERLLICQLCGSNLERLLMSKTCLVSTCNEVKIQSFIQRWRTRFLAQLISYTNGYLEIEGASHWIGGIGNHKDAFIPLYANLLGLHALSQFHYRVSSSSMERGCHTSPLLSDFIRLDTVIGPFLRNPLISNLYFSVIQTFEKLCGVTTATESSKTNCPLWKGFNPYFLLN